MKQQVTLTPGDVLVKQERDGWSVFKILAVDQWPDGSAAAHCLVYESMTSKPAIPLLKNAEVRVWHMPIDASSVDEGWEIIGNQAVAENELVGFVEYLKLTDFPRYLTVSGQDLDQIVGKASEHYRRACRLGDEGKREEAIAEYDAAIELFPLFFEAIDNRAFTFMELGNFREALRGFEESLRVNPDGMSAFFSRGECLMKLGDLTSAEAIFREGLQRFPEQGDLFRKFLDRVHELQK